jgi:predicted N-acetyltransferase YhbS
MSRQPVSMRQATIGDVPFLVELWSSMLRRADRQDQVHDLELIVKEAAESAERRLLIAEYDGEPAGAVLLRVVPLTPLNLEPTVQAIAPHVTPSFRGKGIGSALMEAAVMWAEDSGIAHISTAAPAGSRSGNRFMARLSLGPQAVLRASSTPLVRSKLAALQPASARISDRMAGRRHLGQVLAARRQLNRRTSEGTGSTS